MRKFLIPVDFSEISANALQYALDMSSYGDHLEIIHIRSGLLSMGNPPVVFNVQQSENQTRDLLMEYLAESLEIDKLPSSCEVRVKTGEVITSLIHHIDEGEYDMVIMGTRDKYDLFDKWMGTISLGLVKRSPVPVLLIPKDAVYNGVSKVLVAGDKHLTNESTLEFIAEWNKPYQAEIQFIHVQENPQDQFADEASAIVGQYFEKREVPFSFSVAILEGKNVAETIIEEAEKEKADLVFVVPEKQSYISAILFKNTSKELILKGRTPMLFIKN